MPDARSLKAATRVSTLAGTVDACGTGLHDWLQKQAVAGLIGQSDLLALAATTNPGDDPAVTRLTRMAVERSGHDSAANLGTAIHSGVQAVIDGGSVAGLPELIRRDVDAVLTVVRETFGDVLATERFVAVTGLPELAAGSADYVVRGQRLPALIGDLKTSARPGAARTASLKWAAQLSAYARGRPYTEAYDRDRWGRPLINPDLAVAWDALGMPAPSTRVGAVISLVRGSGRAEVIPVDLRAGWAAMHLAAQVRAARKAGALIAS